MAEPDDYDDAAIDELMMNGGGDFGEPSSAELEMEFEMEQEREREMMGGPTGEPPTGPPPAAPQPSAEPEPGLGDVGMEEEEEEEEEGERTLPWAVKASFSLPDGEGQINLLERPASGPGKLVPPSGSLLARPVASLMQDLDRRAAFELEAEANPPPPPPANPTDDPAKGGQLWVDKYAPRAFVERKDEFGETIVRRGATIGANATIVCGRTIGRFAMVGAGAVVTRNVLDYQLVVGTPAAPMGWVSKSGERLGDDLICPRTRERYEETDTGLTLV